MAARLGTTGALAAIGAALGRHGPGQPGSAEGFPGEYPGPAGAFATGMVLDAAPGGVDLALFAADAAGADDRYEGASDDELVGAICAWDRAEAHMAARKHAAIAEFIRRRPAADCPLQGPARMPAAWDEFTADELSLALASDLEVKLPGTRAAFRDGTLRVSKARIIADAARTLDPGQARAAEALVLARAGKLTPGGLRAAIARAVMQVAPEAARKRREEAAKDARVERWAEDSGNAALVGRELPPAEVLAADQRINWWARQLKKAGLAGDMDELRARPTWTSCSTRTPAPARPPGPATTAQATMDQDRRGRPGQTARRRRQALGPAGYRPGSPAGSTSQPRWPPCSTWPAGPARSPASAPSTRIPEQIHEIVT
ncbi:MAG: hypothetical protein ACRDOU_32160, partial [Streptosporangiaceae bacterium]